MFNLFPKFKSVDDLIDDLLPLTDKFYEENKKLKTQNSELMKENLNLRNLKQENVNLIEMLAKYRDGFQGSCYACEPVGELNQKQEQEIIALKNELQYQLDQNKKLDLQLVALHKIVEGAKTTIDNQKHPMYPIHWGTLDPDIYEQVKDQSIEEVVESLKGMKTQGFEDYDPSDFVKTEKQIVEEELLKKELERIQENQREVYGVEKPAFLSCACGDCQDRTKQYNKQNEKYPTWEEVASDLALRVVKLEKKVEELTLIKNSYATPYSALDKNGNLRGIDC